MVRPTIQLAPMPATAVSRVPSGPASPIAASHAASAKVASEFPIGAWQTLAGAPSSRLSLRNSSLEFFSVGKLKAQSSEASRLLTDALVRLGVENPSGEEVESLRAFGEELSRVNAPETRGKLEEELVRVKKDLESAYSSLFELCKSRDIAVPEALRGERAFKLGLLTRGLKEWMRIGSGSLFDAFRREARPSLSAHRYGQFPDLNKVSCWFFLSRAQKLELFGDIVLQTRLRCWEQRREGTLAEELRDFILRERAWISERARQKFPERDAAFREEILTLLAAEPRKNPEIQRQMMRRLTRELGLNWDSLLQEVAEDAEMTSQETSHRVNREGRALCVRTLERVLLFDPSKMDFENFIDKLRGLEIALERSWSLHWDREQDLSFIEERLPYDRFVQALIQRWKGGVRDLQDLQNLIEDEEADFAWAISRGFESVELAEIVGKFEEDDRRSLAKGYYTLAWTFLTSHDRARVVQAVLVNAWHRSLHQMAWSWRQRLDYLWLCYKEKYASNIGGQEVLPESRSEYLLGPYSHYYRKSCYDRDIHPDIALGQLILELFWRRQNSIPELSDAEGQRSSGLKTRILQAALAELEKYRGRVGVEEYRAIFDRENSGIREELGALSPRMESYSAAFESLIAFRAENHEALGSQRFRLNQVKVRRKILAEAFEKFYEKIAGISPSLLEEIEAIFNPNSVADALQRENLDSLKRKVLAKIHPDKFAQDPAYDLYQVAASEFETLGSSIKNRDRPNYGRVE